MRIARWAVFTAFLGAAAQAQAAPQWLVAANAGVSVPGGGLTVGPEVGAWAALSPWRQFAFELAAGSSFHRARLSETETTGVWRATASLGGQYRIDLGSAIPYAAVRVVGQRYAAPGLRTSTGVGGNVAVGVYLPIASSLFVGAEARYGFFFTSTAFPAGFGFGLSVGWRSRDF